MPGTGTCSRDCPRQRLRTDWRRPRRSTGENENRAKGARRYTRGRSHRRPTRRVASSKESELQLFSSLAGRHIHQKIPTNTGKGLQATRRWSDNRCLAAGAAFPAASGGCSSSSRLSRQVPHAQPSPRVASHLIGSRGTHSSYHTAATNLPWSSQPWMFMELCRPALPPHPAVTNIWPAPSAFTASACIFHCPSSLPGHTCRAKEYWIPYLDVGKIRGG